VTLSPHLKRGGESLSHQINKGQPIVKPERRKQGPKGLARAQMERKPSRLKRGPVGHASAEQKAKVLREGRRMETPDRFDAGRLEPAHITPRPHGGCDHEHCIVPLTHFQHERYDRGELDILPHLTLDEQAHAAGHLGLLGALKRTTGDNYIPGRSITGGAA
jgi:hypothetical protein